ncbi:MAG: 4Fe-4S dicluster domain-containing protein, partial [Candidatus Methanomethylophilaceae archaeon]|nr:4Fe-4S dicluster domain-containing protein [Candidatus Methanomethylophilaceae archaeon]
MNHLKIDLDKCVGCGKCAKMCLKNNIVIEDRKAKEVGTDCLECSHCVSSCPKGAIELLPRAKEDETVFSSIKKDKMFDGGMVSDKDLAELVESMTQGRKDRYEIFVL